MRHYLKAEWREKLLGEQFLQLRLGGVRPNPVTSFVGMQIVGHDGLGNRAVAFNQLGTEIHVENVLAVIEPGERLVDLQNFSALLAELMAARKNAQQNDFCLRL